MTRAIALLLFASLAWAQQPPQVPPISRDALRSGDGFSGAEVRAIQADDAANPGMLGVLRGEALWREAAPGGACASCHGAMKGVATRYPAVDKASGKLLNLETRISQCRTERQKAPGWRYESEELLSITAYVAHQSRGLPMNVAIDGPARPYFEAGQRAHVTRRGQLNLSCSQCHDKAYGRQLWRETVSQGHGTAYPAYRLEWNGLGSLQRRLRACQQGVRAEIDPYGAQPLAELELYLAWRSQQLPVETPGVRR